MMHVLPQSNTHACYVPQGDNTLMASKLLQLEERLVKVEARRSMPGALTMAPSEGTAPSHANTGIIVDRLAALEGAAQVRTAWAQTGVCAGQAGVVAHNKTAAFSAAV